MKRIIQNIYYTMMTFWAVASWCAGDSALVDVLHSVPTYPRLFYVSQDSLSSAAAAYYPQGVKTWFVAWCNVRGESLALVAKENIATEVIEGRLHVYCNGYNIGSIHHRDIGRGLQYSFKPDDE